LALLATALFGARIHLRKGLVDKRGIRMTTISRSFDGKRRTGLANSPRPDNLLAVKFVAPSTLELVFADRMFPLEIGLLEMPIDRIRWETASVPSTGDSMTVKAFKGETIAIDSGVLRCLVDEQYAAEIKKSLTALQLTEDEFTQIIESQGPRPQWLDEPEQDPRLDSWK
jgi:hypothetical protein